MSRRHHSPTYLRYLKARLWNLARPSVWGTAIFLSIVGLVIKEYWIHPDFLTHWQKNQVADNNKSANLSEEDRAIAADIDNLPLLYNTDSDQVNPPAAKTLASKQNTQVKNNKSLLDTLNSNAQTSTSDAKSKPDVKESNSTPVQTLENPFVTQAESLLQLSNFQNRSYSQSNALTSSIGQQNSVQNSFQNNVSESALQTALNQSKNQNQRNPLELSSQLSTENRGVQSLIPNTGLNRNTNTINSLNAGTASTQSGAISPTSYIQPGISNQLPNPTSGTGYPQPGFNNLQPQNPVAGTGYIQPGISNQPQNSFPRTAYPQPQFGQTGIPQTPSAVPNPSATLFNEIMRNRLNNINSGQALPSIGQPTSVPSPSSNTLTNIAPNYTPNQGSVNYNTPVIPNNYGNSGSQIAPAPVPQYIYSSPQIPKQSSW
ncbi:MAG: hypothetical protein KME30_08160 [Iphinoe sp. HA4291-MV1]|jgi:hypothetical protein|nr:hypothetical protein [Iphinoe sp. HA4291-MV1]